MLLPQMMTLFSLQEVLSSLVFSTVAAFLLSCPDGLSLIALLTFTIVNDRRGDENEEFSLLKRGALVLEQ